MFQDLPTRPGFADLLRSRDTRRELLLDRRERSQRQQQKADAASSKEPATPVAGKGKGAVVSGYASGKAKGKSPALPVADATSEHFSSSEHRKEKSPAFEAIPATANGSAGSLWSELCATVLREQTLRRSLIGHLGDSSTAESTASSKPSSDGTAQAPSQLSQDEPAWDILAPVPEILLRHDLSKYIERLEDEAAAKRAAQANTRLNKEWLLSKCRDLVAASDMDTSNEAAEALCTEVFTVLRADRSDNDIQGQLLELVGFDNMDFLSMLISKRSEIVSAIVKESDYSRVARELKNNKQIPGVQAVIRSEKDIAIEKDIHKSKRNKARRKTAQASNEKGDSDDQHSAQILGFGFDLRRARERQLTKRAPEILRPESHGPVRFPHVYTTGASDRAGGNMLSAFGSKYALPAGTTRDEFPDHEELTIPISTPAPRRQTEQPVLIEDMDPMCRYTFRKYTSLNRIQSIIYPTAYGTNENILLSAPTGAGKTDVALLTILRTISQYCSPHPGDLDGLDDVSAKPELTVAKSEFKIVYIAPMKALAAEVVEKYQSRLKWLGIKCRELTGDMQLTKAEVSATQIIVTTPEKWDVVTRKSSGDMELVDRVKLLIIDEIHLLNEDRGSVIETLIARTQRQVESRQNMIRLVGLSATLPNYVDVSNFLGVNPYKGLFYFDAGFRPVPLEQHFVGVHGKPGTQASARLLNRVCYERVERLVAEGNQVMVFVHARKDTVKTAQTLRELAMADGTMDQFLPPDDQPPMPRLLERVQKSHNRELKDLFHSGFSIHHAGMLRSDRNLVEELFAKGLIRVLCCTSTLAWGVNLPAYAVVIKGTQVYDSQKGAFVDLSILDVLQIFGRAGRPQYETNGVGYILTTHDRLAHYVSAITMQHPIESKFASNMIDNLNAEITLGTVTNVNEGVAWLGYTYMFIRMQKNPLVYGLTGDEVGDDPFLGQRRSELIIAAAKELNRLQMIVFDEATGFMAAKDLGRISSAYYLRHQSVEAFNQSMRPRMTEADGIALLCLSKEFDQIRVRNTETKELKKLLATYCCCDVKGGVDSPYGKTSILLQSNISRAFVEDFSLVSDSAYVAQNGARIIRALFEIALSRNWGPAAAVALSLSKSIEKRMWPFEHPLKQFSLPQDIMRHLENANGVVVDMERLYDMDSGELGALVHNHRYGAKLASFINQVPRLDLSAEIVPITRSVLQVTLTATADFEWNDKVHGTGEAFWVWVEDMDNTEIYHTENVLIRRKGFGEPIVSVFTIPIHEPLPSQIFIRAVSDRWVGAETVTAVSFRHLMLPEHHEMHTDLLDLQPLPIAALQDPCLEETCRARFTHFNPVQTQIFHTLYRQPFNALVGAPTGSGKTVAAELAMWWAFREHPQRKVVYIAPLKALVKERVVDWGKRLTGPMKRTLVELTGDVTPDPESIRNADIIITTPEKWDGVSRAWHAREYVQNVSLVIIDEIHLLGGDRGPILEVIVSRMNHIAAQMGKSVRVVGLSTALANARDLADWLGIAKVGLYNFRHSVRPVPLEIYIDGFPGRHYCPRMASMNRPAYRAIRTHSPSKPVIIFVSSRRQTRLTSQDLMAFCGMEENPRHFLHMDDWEIEAVLERTQDPNLRLSLSFGIGMHHAGLTENDRKICEQLFHDRKIQILVATSTLAWGVNLPAHLVILKGTEFFDAKSKGYVDFPITDVLQMIGRAGRPQFDDRAVAKIFVTDTKKEFYKKFLHEPFPVESSLHMHLHEHINAEVASGAVKSAQDAVDYLSWTYLYRRLRQNPSYYGVEESTESGVNKYLSKLILDCFSELERALCITVEQDYGRGSVLVAPTPLGKIASQYYLSHKTMRTFSDRLDSINGNNRICDLLHLLSEAAEWAELPVRHNEDILNRELERQVPFSIGRGKIDYLSPHAKANLLLQKHLVRGELPCSDYVTDTRTVLDSSIRILQAMVDVAAYKGDLVNSLAIMELMQGIKQAAMPKESPLRQLRPDLSQQDIDNLHASSQGSVLRSVGNILVLDDKKLRDAFRTLHADESRTDEWCQSVRALPALDVKIEPGSAVLPLAGSDSESKGTSIRKAATSKKIDSLNGLKPATQYSIVVTLKHTPVQTSVKQHRFIKEPGQAFTPRFGKTQYEGWWVVLAEGKNDLLALKRVSMQGKSESSGVWANSGEQPAEKNGRSSHGSAKNTTASDAGRSVAGSSTQHTSRTARLLFITPEEPGAYVLRLVVMSDAYLGLDQTFDVNIRVGENQMTLTDTSSYISKEQMKEYQ
ncbi:activating signal cointegrator 1 complex subunit 3 [Coemansia sp. RSA 1813]|nr:putative steryl acetyl hydrolase mug81 [Coemansia sp. RSA 1646]KAJ1771752.1 activating signal cointegrator 1 complex subunit 3 [Coemansia sp. RSA 1843]KAJ2091683.1 activating signal cointegrator 1 complex subunit 3 [Coemansia sp. RSA 986]KAJ2216915.1 activating signal cointegrator 1 complex subunit 3 [Coemansia sp. RSA 487]KAJ2571918.1 activating signal cointegrator 1 complex subunit 3 [Coemansia sp. RSA 1813]